jgi:hypothetical protein
MAPNSALQRAGTHKVLGRGRPSRGGTRERWRARVLMGRRAAAELGSYANSLLSSSVSRADVIFG